MRRRTTLLRYLKRDYLEEMLESSEYALAPGSWRLMRIDGKDRTDVLDRNVRSYDLAGRELIVTNGSVAPGLGGSGRELRYRDDLIEAVAVV